MKLNRINNVTFELIHNGKAIYTVKKTSGNPAAAWQVFGQKGNVISSSKRNSEGCSVRNFDFFSAKQLAFSEAEKHYVYCQAA